MIQTWKIGMWSQPDWNVFWTSLIYFHLTSAVQTPPTNQWDTWRCFTLTWSWLCCRDTLWTVPHALLQLILSPALGRSSPANELLLGCGPQFCHTLQTYSDVGWSTETRWELSGASVPACCASPSLGGCWKQAGCLFILYLLTFETSLYKHYLGTAFWLEHLVSNIVTFVSPHAVIMIVFVILFFKNRTSWLVLCQC